MEAAHKKRNPARRRRSWTRNFTSPSSRPSHNVILLHMMRAMFRLLRRAFSSPAKMISRAAPPATCCSDITARSNDALGRPATAPRAGAAVTKHLTYVESRLADLKRAREERGGRAPALTRMNRSANCEGPSVRRDRPQGVAVLPVRKGASRISRCKAVARIGMRRRHVVVQLDPEAPARWGRPDGNPPSTPWACG